MNKVVKLHPVQDFAKSYRDIQWWYRLDDEVINANSTVNSFATVTVYQANPLVLNIASQIAIPLHYSKCNFIIKYVTYWASQAYSALYLIVHVKFFKFIINILALTVH